MDMNFVIKLSNYLYLIMQSLMVLYNVILIFYQNRNCYICMINDDCYDQFFLFFERILIRISMI